MSLPTTCSSDFRELVKPPYLLITTLRNPLELYVSSQQFMHRESTATLEEATTFVANKMEKRMGYVPVFLLDSTRLDDISTGTVTTRRSQDQISSRLL